MQTIKIGYDTYNASHKKELASLFQYNEHLNLFNPIVNPSTANEKYFYPIYFPWDNEPTISKTVVNDIKDGRCKLVIDYITESECYNKDDYYVVYPELDDYDAYPESRNFHKKVSSMLENNNLDWDFVFIDCNPFNEIKYDNCIYLNRWMYECYTHLAFKNERQHDFSSFNRRVTKSRLKICENLNNKNALWSCGAVDDQEWYKEFKDLFHLLPKTVDKDFTAAGEAMPISDWMIPSSYIHIINETFTFYNENCLFLTEKTFDCMNARTPFLLVGQPFSLKHLQDLGFKTFSEFWDESYDEIINTRDRVNKILEVIDELGKRNIKEVFNSTKPILEHNREVLKTYNLQRNMILYNKLSNLGFI